MSKQKTSDGPVADVQPETATPVVAEAAADVQPEEGNAGPLPVEIVTPKEKQPQPNTPPAFRGPDPGPGRYLVSLPNVQPVLVDAPSRADAWAKFCDGRKTYPSPKTAGLTIERQGDVGGRPANNTPE